MCERGFTGATIAAISHDEQALARDEDAIYRATYRERAAITTARWDLSDEMCVNIGVQEVLQLQLQLQDGFAREYGAAITTAR